MSRIVPVRGMVRVIDQKPPAAPEEKRRRPRRSKAEIAAGREEKERRKAERIARASQRAEEVAVRAAQRNLVEEAKAARLQAIKDAALRDADRALARISARAPSTSARWDREREQEKKRMRALRRALRKRQSVALEAPPIVQAEGDWLAANDRPVVMPEDEPEPAIPGMVCAVSEVRRHVESTLDLVPAEWSSGWVMKRIIDAYVALSRLPGAVRPAAYRRAWPSYLTEVADELDRKTTIIKVASFEDIERMEAVFGWPAAHLADAPDASRALFKWASGKVVKVDQRRLAASFGMAPSTFRRFRMRAATLLAHRLNRVGVSPF
ncbi:Uncharacterised protein [Starkeya nomas]|uniref:Uncharacterized protein n=1 Tax=Starkeya nomas TaxID=2666134 RepID=A0A5S9NZU1_9HYPH|nr:hypothetical protein [Starkeya nomas]CAA0096381.1 Uncharacterised protein [Starkeya nomas]